MTEKTRKQLGVLGALVAVFVAVMFVVSRGEGPAVGPATPSNQRGAATGAGAQQAVPPVVDVRLESLKTEREGPAEPERNLFAFRPKAPPPRPREIEPQPAPVIVAPPAPTGPPPPPPIPLKFIGVLEIPSQGAKVAILSDGRGGTFHAREGETVLGQYRVVRIQIESVVMEYADGKGRQTIPMR